MQGPDIEAINLLVRNGLRLPRYAGRDRNGRLWFRVDGSARRVPLPNDPTSARFRVEYEAALIAAIAAEDDSDA